MTDLKKRKSIMQRSIKLGHCICNTRQACPCEIFKGKNVCLCAGERLEDMPEHVELTKFVENAGCASKINQNDLKIVLEGLPEIDNPRVLVSADTSDDAGVYMINDKYALVQSVDVFAPSVDDPYTFGQIAAANSLSDIYAMGGKPLTALSIIGFPIETMSHKVMNQILLGGIVKMKEARVAVIGGHSIKDNEIKFGFAVTGEIHPQRIITNDRAKPGDVLVLTKPLGTGIIGFASQIGRAPESALKAVSQSMAELNKTASEVMRKLRVTTATDVTGFGFLGHLSEIVIQSKVTAEVYVDRVPVFEGVLDLVKQEMISGAIERNKEYASRYVTVESGVCSSREAVLYDAQTSGGLLIAIKEEKSRELVSLLKERGVVHAAVVGGIIGESDGKIILKSQPGRTKQKVAIADQDKENQRINTR
ncbi:MAG: selenide, water dikinase SelD [Candidatus Aminicenantes bacterium]|nr:selenide, water dikinase SelD [Candidatus Aminicenantes bacterium]MDH5707410.1 selenide, water dikinase SelD [Candidatus Aminicenantes bacterium]